MTTIHDACANGPDEPRVKQTPDGERRREEHAQVFRQKKGRQRRDDAAECEEGKEGEKQPRQAEAQQVVAEVLVAFELASASRRPETGRRRRSARRRRTSRRAIRVAALAPPRAIARRPDAWQQQVRETAAHHQTISSIS